MLWTQCSNTVLLPVLRLWVLNTQTQKTIMFRKTCLKCFFSNDFWCRNIDNHKICFEEKYINMYLKTKDFLNTTLILNLQYEFFFFKQRYTFIKSPSSFTSPKKLCFYFITSFRNSISVLKKTTNSYWRFRISVMYADS